MKKSKFEIIATNLSKEEEEKMLQPLQKNKVRQKIQFYQGVNSLGTTFENMRSMRIVSHNCIKLAKLQIVCKSSTVSPNTSDLESGLVGILCSNSTSCTK
jgi:hypothetical protein